MDTPSQPSESSQRPYAVAVGPTSNAAQAHDWAAPPLGPRDNWPQALRTIAGIVLSSNIPMLAAWGPDLLVIHNDSYGEILGDRRPALGRPLREIWSDIWEVVGGNAARVLAGETITVKQGLMLRTLRVVDVPRARVGAKLVPNYCLDLTPKEEFEKARAHTVQQLLAREPGRGRPTKRDRRERDKFFE